MTDLAALVIKIEPETEDVPILAHPRLWNALVAEVIAGRKYDDLQIHTNGELYKVARATTDAALKG